MFSKYEIEYLNGKLWNMKEYKEYDKKNKVINEIKEGKGLIKDYDPKGILLF